ncbi:serine protease [Actinoplanes sp. NPDC048988]|uniref:S1 family peptidase n=1 Tax=Actinoplanes sp. NPDC048988 TaxID=3363901 RepID=UPI003712FEA0
MTKIERALGSALVTVGKHDQKAPEGAGLLLTRTHILTCAHVVNSSLNRSENAADGPSDTETVRLSFPFITPTEHYEARVRAWVPPFPNGSGDVAVLQLVESAPADARPAQLIRTQDLNRHEFWCYGFPNGYSGRQASGRLLRTEPNGLVALEDVKSTGARIEAGFSGAPVWDEDLGGVVGLVVQEDLDAMARRAFCIPTGKLVEILEHEWPPIRQTVVPARRSAVSGQMDRKYKSVWYRSTAPEFTFKNLAGVRETTGELIVGRDYIWYEPLDMVIFAEDILRVRLSKAGADFINMWVQIEHETPHGRAIAYFASGQLLGYAGLAGRNRAIHRDIVTMKESTKY